MGRIADNRRYSVQRTLLILLMGSKCKYCPERRPWRLEFHHTDNGGWEPEKTSRHRRIRLYMRDWSNGILVLACTKCNKKMGKPKWDDVVPF
jgi:hypothetical protein